MTEHMEAIMPVYEEQTQHNSVTMRFYRPTHDRRGLLLNNPPVHVSINGGEGFFVTEMQTMLNEGLAKFEAKEDSTETEKHRREAGY